MGSPYSSFRDLEVWKLAMDLALAVYHVTRTFPEEETVGIASKMQGAAVSIATNIAGGYGRGNTADFLEFLLMAGICVTGLQCQLAVACQLGYVEKEAEVDLATRIETVSEKLEGLRGVLRVETSMN